MLLLRIAGNVGLSTQRASEIRVGAQLLRPLRKMGKAIFPDDQFARQDDKGVDLRFIDQHHRDVVANGIDPLAFHAFQAVFVLFQLDRSFAERTDENFQQILADGHNV